MTIISTKPPAPNVLSILDFTDAEKKALLCLMGSIKMRKDAAITSIIRRLEQHFSDDDFEEAFNTCELIVYSDGVKLDPSYVELEVKNK
jgi:hypothetical protein